MITVRIASATDAKLIADLSRKTFYEAFAKKNTKENMEKFLNESFTKEALIKEVGAEGNIFLQDYVGETPVGYVRIRDG
jgi:hypothetical protein